MKLHVGCGPRIIPGFVHVDIIPYEHVDHVSAVDDLHWLSDESVELIYASHVLEHFARAQVTSVLREWFRVLQPGGRLRLAVPDFAACAKIYYEEGLANGLTGLIGLIVGGQRDAHDFHKMVFDEPLLTAMLKEVGFSKVRRWDWRRTEHAAIDDFSQAYLPHMDKQSGLHMSLNLEAEK
jgi:predicted SAM-dependent methyltransferase